MNILDQLADKTRLRIEEQKKQKDLEPLKQEVLAMKKKNHAFYKALKKPGLSVICECKKASPSKGLICEDYHPDQQAALYKTSGADAISVLSEPSSFLGSDEHVEMAAASTDLPILRKDFTVDPYMIYQARSLNADAVLLITALLSEEELREDLEIVQSLGMDAIVECHDADEIRQALAAGASIIGINNRNLKNFSVDVNHASSLEHLIPKNVLLVSESGILKPEDVRNMHVDAVLIGEAMMKSKDPAAFLKQMKAYEAAR